MAEQVTPREAGGRAAWAAFWRGTRPWPEGSTGEQWREFWCDLAAKAHEATEVAQAIALAEPGPEPPSGGHPV